MAAAVNPDRAAPRWDPVSEWSRGTGPGPGRVVCAASRGELEERMRAVGDLGRLSDDEWQATAGVLASAGWLEELWQLPSGELPVDLLDPRSLAVARTAGRSSSPTTRTG